MSRAYKIDIEIDEKELGVDMSDRLVLRSFKVLLEKVQQDVEEWVEHVRAGVGDGQQIGGGE